MTHYLLIGVNGQLGWELHRTLATLGEVSAADYPEFDLTQTEQVRDYIRQLRPQVIVNAAAYTAVDQAETDTAAAEAINQTAPGVLAELAVELKAALLHYSTDYVFDGAKGAAGGIPAAAYTEQDEPNPLNAYGRTKLGGEQAIRAACSASRSNAYLILRTSWVYSTRRGSFVTKVLEWARRNPELRIVSDQVGSPTWARMLAQATAHLLASAGSHPVPWLAERSGLYHLAGSGCTSRLDWAKAVLALDPQPGEQVARQLLPARTADFPTPARRPLFSALDNSLFTSTFGFDLPPWQHALRLCMENKV